MLLLIIIIAAGVFLGQVSFKAHTDNPGKIAAAVLKVRYGMKYTVYTLIGILTVGGVGKQLSEMDSMYWVPIAGVTMVLLVYAWSRKLHVSIWARWLAFLESRWNIPE